MSADTIDEVDIGESISIRKESTEHVNEQSKEELGERSVNKQALERVHTQEQEQEQEHEQEQEQEQEQTQEQEQEQEQEREEAQEQEQEHGHEPELIQEYVQKQAQDTLAPERDQALQQDEEQADIVISIADASAHSEETEVKETVGQPILEEVDLAEPSAEKRTDIPKIEINESDEPLAPQIKEASQALTREEKVEAIKKLRKDITSLVSNIRNTKKLCDKYKNENQYLQEYVGSMMASGEMK